MKGTVSSFNTEKGFGFIKTDDGKIVFMHVNGLIDQVKINDRVDFEIVQGKKGPEAVKVKKSK